MKINEILDRMQELVKHKYDKEIHTYNLFDDIQGLLDYITNLQEENERLEEIIENLTTMTVCGDKKQIKNTAQYKLDIYKSRKILQEFQKDLKNILNGDKE